MTFVTVFLRLLRKNMGMSQRKILMLSAGEENRGQLSRLFKRILIGTLIFEGLGAALLSIRFIGDFGVGKGIYYSIWHSISAFCNAGFDLMGGTFGGEKFVSLTHYATDPLVSLTICCLIIIGGLGFCVWDDFLETRGRYKKFRLHTKVVLLMTMFLLIVSTALFFSFEYSNPTLEEYTIGEKFLVAFFNATTPRTAGFNTIDLNSLSDSGYLLMLMLMFVGGSSASTAGGIKVTTMFIIIMGISSVFRGKRSIEVGKRRVHHALLQQALAVFVSCLFIVLTATLFICAFEGHNEVTNFQSILFEAFSAMGTVGLSLGITPSLEAASQIALIILMYTGRVGILTIGLAFGEKRDTSDVKKPVDTLLIG